MVHRFVVFGLSVVAIALALGGYTVAQDTGAPGAEGTPAALGCATPVRDADGTPDASAMPDTGTLPAGIRTLTPPRPRGSCSPSSFSISAIPRPS